MRKGLFYICLLLVGVGLFAGCKSKKAVVASFSDLDGEWEGAFRLEEVITR